MQGEVLGWKPDRERTGEGITAYEGHLTVERVPENRMVPVLSFLRVTTVLWSHRGISFILKGICCNI
jgi:hypothetical protein